MVFGPIITIIFFTRSPEYLKLSHFDSILYPIKSHVDGSGTLLLPNII